MTTDESRDRRLFDALPQDDPPTNARLHQRLLAEAQRDGLLDVAYRTVHTPVGELLLAATEAGLVRIAYPRQDHDAVLVSLAESISPRVLHAPGRLTEAAQQVDEYFAGSRTSFDLTLDWRLARGFRRAVLERLSEIGYGRTASYARLAAEAGSPRAVRAAGTACATNPLPVVLPCHRVVRSDGSTGGYVGGAEAKNVLLSLEGAA